MALEKFKDDAEKELWERAAIASIQSGKTPDEGKCAADDFVCAWRDRKPKRYIGFRSERDSCPEGKGVQP